MNSFEHCNGIGVQALKDIVPFLRARAHDSRFVTTDKGCLSELLQTSVGDVLLNTPDGKVWGLELKAEEANLYNNFFLETWSNLSFGRQKPGWMVTLQCDVLLYYFVREGELYSIPFRRLFEFCFGNGEKPPMLFQYPHKPQRKHRQLNLTVGHVVPIAEVQRYVGFRKYRLVGDGFVEVRDTTTTRGLKLIAR